MKDKRELLAALLNGKLSYRDLRRKLGPDRIVHAVETDQKGVFDAVVNIRQQPGWKREELVVSESELNEMISPTTRAFIVRSI